MNASAPKNTHDRIARLSFIEGPPRVKNGRAPYHGVNEVNEIQPRMKRLKSLIENEDI